MLDIPVLGVGGRGEHLVTFVRYSWHIGMQPSRDVTAHPNVFRAGVTRGLTTITMEKSGRRHTSSTAGSRLYVAKGPAASCGEVYEHVAPAYQIQYHFPLLGPNF